MAAMDMVSRPSTKYKGQQRMGRSTDKQFADGASGEYVLAVPAGMKYIISEGTYTVLDCDTVIVLHVFNEDVCDERWTVVVVEGGVAYGPSPLVANDFRGAMAAVTAAVVQPS